MKVLNFGSLNIDYVYHVEHFVRPGETLSTLSLEKFCGGKGLNQSIAAARAGCSVFHAGKIGSDGGMLKNALSESGVRADYVAESSQPTGHAIIQVDRKGQNCILLHSGANCDMDEAFIDRVLENFESGDILLLQNEINNIPAIMEKAHRKGMKIALNPSPINREINRFPMKYVSWFLLNEIEGNELSGRTEPEGIASELLEKYPGSAVVLTLGKKGVCYRDGSRSASHGIYNVRPVDTTAAGDTFTGYFIAGVTEGLEIPEILRRASVASSIAVSRPGASPSIPTLEEVLASRLELAT